MTNEERLAMLDASIKEQLKKCNADVEKLENVKILEDLITDYNKTAEAVTFRNMNRYENPIVAAILTNVYSGYKLEEVRDEDSANIESYSVIEREFQINLKKLNDKLKLSKIWIHKLDCLNQDLCLKKGIELGITEESMQNAINSLHINKEVKRIKASKKAVSNTQLTKRLQEIIDLVIFKDNGNGKNEYKCNNHDIAWLYGAYGKYSKTIQRAIKPSQTRTVLVYFADVVSRILTGDVYSYETKEQRDALSAKKRELNEKVLATLPFKKVSKEANEETKEDGKVSEETNDEK